MTNQRISESDSERICNHMNNDHQDAIRAYVSYYAKQKDAKEVRMISINKESMTLEADGKALKIPFDQQISNAKDAHTMLVNMLREIPTN